MSNPTYNQEQADFIRQFLGSDAELTTTFNRMFGTNIGKSALRKKRQRLGVARTPEQFRVEWMCLIGFSTEEIGASLLGDPPKDIYAEQKELAAARKMKER